MDELPTVRTGQMLSSRGMDPASIFRIGTSGYSFPDWVGPFYPPGTRRQEMFAQYVRQFRTVELNYTFYRMPAARTLERLVQASPPDFLFWVKANQRTTHEHDRTAAAEFLANLEPLRAGRRLAGVLMQFPQNFHRTVANRQVLRDTVEDFKAVPLAVEFRHGSWDHPATYEGLRERGLTLVVPDVPPLGDLFHPEATVTSRIGYLRLHSRNAAQWYAGGVQRYDYDYSDAELTAIRGVWNPLAEWADCVFVFFNNCRHGQAAKNARRFAEITQAG